MEENIVWQESFTAVIQVSENVTMMAIPGNFILFFIQGSWESVLLEKRDVP